MLPEYLKILIIVNHVVKRTGIVEAPGMSLAGDGNTVSFLKKVNTLEGIIEIPACKQYTIPWKIISGCHQQSIDQCHRMITVLFQRVGIAL